MAYLVLCKLSTACPMLAMAIKHPKEDLFRIAPKPPVHADSILQQGSQSGVWTWHYGL